MKDQLLRFLAFAWLIPLLLTGCSNHTPGQLAPDAQPGQVPALAGEYIVNGFDPTGIEYGGRLRITEGSQPGEYVLQWLISGGLQEGTGKLQGNRLLVSWHSLPGLGRETQGSAEYTITTQGELYGTRRFEGFEKEGSETAYPNSPENMSK